MNKIGAIVFSKDRAAQLKLFLDSVIENANGIFDLNVFVEYTDEKYREGYELVVSDAKYGDINFIYPEAHKALYPNAFKDKVVEVMEERCDYFTFFLDDDIIYNKVELADITSTIESDDDIVCFSLRLGENTTKCYTLGAENVMHDMDVNGDVMKWDWTLHYLDFGYPFAMDGHVFRRKDILKLVKKTSFVNVEELEMGLFDFCEVFPRNMMASYTTSRLVNVPAGRVQQSIEDEMAATMKEGEARLRRKAMNAIFLSGESLNLENIDFSNIEGCHQKIALGKSFDKAIEKTESHPMDRIAFKTKGKRWEELTEDEQKEINDSIERIQLAVQKQQDND